MGNNLKFCLLDKHDMLHRWTHCSSGYLRKSAQNQASEKFQHRGRKDSHGTTTADDLLSIDRGRLILLGMWAMVEFPCPSGLPHTYSPLSNIKWTPRVKTNKQINN